MDLIWRNVCTHYDVPEEVVNAWFTRIHKQLNVDSPSRSYHNWEHMMHHKLPHLSNCAPSIALAAFFQYYYFDGNRSCVKQNVEVFEEFSRDAMIDDEEVKSLICSLLGHKSAKNEVFWCHDNEANLLQDIDLAILASSPEEYKHYTQLLRYEYANLDDSTYKIMRLKVLETLLMIPSIYATPEYRNRYEELARKNIRKEIDELKQ